MKQNTCCILISLVLLATSCWSEEDTRASVEANADLYPTRVLEFPSDISIGVLHIADPATTLPSNWRPLGEARGRVQIPAGQVVSLRISTTSAGRLDTLAQLKPDDIQFLSLRRVKVPRDGWSNIRHLTGLKRLVIARTGISPRDFECIDGMKRLEYLDASFNSYLNEALERIGKLENLRWLDLANTRITGKGLRHLASLPKLEDLNLNGNRLRPSDLAELKNCKSLRKVSISAKSGGLSWLADLPLTHVAIPTYELSRANHPPPPTGLNQRNVSIVAGMKTLKVLELNGGKNVLPFIEEDLRRSLPNVHLIFPEIYLKEKRARGKMSEKTK